MTTEQIQEATKNPYKWQFPMTIDGYFFTESPAKTYEEGKQAKVPLLAGWNSEESGWRSVLGNVEPTPENYEKVINEKFGEKAGEVLRLYPGKTREEVIDYATDLAGDQFIAYSTWKWADIHSRTSGKKRFSLFLRASATADERCER